jgi:glycosyltransferase involved in cell wall biosynthesis
MKIAQVTQPIIPTPPNFYGGTERIVSMLTEELVKRGHNVTLYATGDSKTKAKLKYLFRKGVGIDDFRPIHSLTQVKYVFNESDKYDIVHNHADAYCTPLTEFIKTPVITTLHNDYIIPGTPQFNYFRNACYYAFISKNQQERLHGLKSAGVVYNATDMNKYKLCTEKKDYMFFIGNMTLGKGPDIAVKVARELKEKLIMATKIDAKHEDFFQAKVKPYVDGKMTKLHKLISFEKKLKLYQQAKCLIFPIRWQEPFGLVMTEAMACGTPVVALDNGSVSEIVRHGETGFVAKNYSELKKYIKRVNEIDPKACRRWVEKNFSIKAMADGYEHVYKKILKSG